MTDSNNTLTIAGGSGPRPGRSRRFVQLIARSVAIAALMAIGAFSAVSSGVLAPLTPGLTALAPSTALACDGQLTSGDYLNGNASSSFTPYDDTSTVYWTVGRWVGSWCYNYHYVSLNGTSWTQITGSPTLIETFSGRADGSGGGIGGSAHYKSCTSTAQTTCGTPAIGSWTNITFVDTHAPYASTVYANGTVKGGTAVSFTSSFNDPSPSSGQANVGWCGSASGNCAPSYGASSTFSIPASGTFTVCDQYKDNAGWNGASSCNAFPIVPADTTPPNVSMYFTANGSTSLTSTISNPTIHYSYYDGESTGNFTITNSTTGTTCVGPIGVGTIGYNATGTFSACGVYSPGNYTFIMTGSSAGGTAYAYAYLYYNPDTTPPYLGLTGPYNTTITNPTLSYYAYDNESSGSWNIRNMTTNTLCASSSSWVYGWTGLTACGITAGAGNYEFLLSASSLGGASSTNFWVYYSPDTTPPELTLTPVATTMTSPISVPYTVYDPESGGTYSITNSTNSTTCRGSTAFSAATVTSTPLTNCTLALGSNTLIISATSAGGFASLSAITVYDTTAPAASLSAPATSSDTNYGLPYSVYDAQSDTNYTLTNTTAGVVCLGPVYLPAGQTNAYTASACGITATGSYTFTLVATSVGGTTTATATTIYDNTPPTVTLSSPATPQKAAFPLSFTVLDPETGGTYSITNTTSGTVCASNVPFSANTTVNGPLTACGLTTSQTYAFALSATSVGGTTTVTTSTLYDTIAPTVTFTLPDPAKTITFSSALSYSPSWTEADTGGSGLVASTRTLARYSTTLSGGTCGSFGGTPDYTQIYAALPSTSYTDATLASGHCYRWTASVSDGAANIGVTTSTPLGIDTASTSAPTLTPGGGATSYWATDLTSPSSLVWFNGNHAGSVVIGATVSPLPLSGISAYTYGPGGAGWSAGATTLAGDGSGARTYSWTTSGTTSTIAVSATSGAGAVSGPTSLTLQKDVVGPTASFSLPTNLGLSVSADLLTRWTESDLASLGGPAGSGPGSRSASWQYASFTGTAGACAATYSTVVAAAITQDGSAWQTTLPGTSIVGEGCYRLALTLTDRVGNVRAATYSPLVRYDTSAPPTPTVSASGNYVYQAAANGTVWFSSNIATTTGDVVTLNALASDSGSGVSGYAFGPLSNHINWTYDPSALPTSGWGISGGTNAVSPSNSASDPINLLWINSAAGSSVAVHSINGAGAVSSDVNLTIAADTAAPVSSFSAPTGSAIVYGTHSSYGVTFSTADADSGINGAHASGGGNPAGWTLSHVTALTSLNNGTCDTFGSTTVTDSLLDSATKSSVSGHTLTVPSLQNGSCYRFTLTSTDNVGNSGSTTAADLLVDWTAPTATFSAPSGTVRISPLIPGDNASYTLAFTGGDLGGSGIASVVLNRYSGAVVVPNSCSSVAWSLLDSQAITSPASGSPAHVFGATYSDLTPSTCYKFDLTVTDGAGNATTTNSGYILTQGIVTQSTPLTATPGTLSYGYDYVAGADVGGFPGASYLLTLGGGNGGGVVSAATYSNSSSICTVSGPEAGGAYRVAYLPGSPGSSCRISVTRASDGVYLAKTTTVTLGTVGKGTITIGPTDLVNSPLAVGPSGHGTVYALYDGSVVITTTTGANITVATNSPTTSCWLNGKVPARPFERTYQFAASLTPGVSFCTASAGFATDANWLAGPATATLELMSYVMQGPVDTSLRSVSLGSTANLTNTGIQADPVGTGAFSFSTDWSFDSNVGQCKVALVSGQYILSAPATSGGANCTVLVKRAASTVGGTAYPARTDRSSNILVALNEQAALTVTILDNSYPTGSVKVTGGSGSGTYGLYTLTPDVCTVDNATSSTGDFGLTFPSGSPGQICSLNASRVASGNYGPIDTLSNFVVAKGISVIAWPGLPTRTVADTSFVLSAPTANSGLVVTVLTASPEICTYEGSTVYLIRAGTCTLVASSPGNGDWIAPSDLSNSFDWTALGRTLVINGKPLVSRMLGDVFTLGATVTSTVSPVSATAPTWMVGPSGVCSNSPGLGWQAVSTTSANLSGVAYGGGRFMVVGAGGAYASATDPTGSWTSGVMSGDPALRAVASDGTTFIAVGDNGVIRASTNGSSWATPSSGSAANLAAIAYAAGDWIAVGADGSGNAVMLTSSNGTAWTTLTLPSGLGGLTGVAYGSAGSGTWLAVGSDGGIIYSHDGTSWTAISPNPAAQSLRAVAFAADNFVAVGDGGTILTSPNGFIWTVRTDGIDPTTLAGSSLTGLAYANNSWVAAGFPGAVLAASGDGASWVLGTTLGSDQFASIAAGSGAFVAVGANGAIEVNPSYNIATVTTQGYGTCTATASLADNGLWGATSDTTNFTVAYPAPTIAIYNDGIENDDSSPVGADASYGSDHITNKPDLRFTVTATVIRPTQSQAEQVLPNNETIKQTTVARISATPDCTALSGAGVTNLTLCPSVGSPVTRIGISSTATSSEVTLSGATACGSGLTTCVQRTLTFPSVTIPGGLIEGIWTVTADLATDVSGHGRSPSSALNPELYLVTTAPGPVGISTVTAAADVGAPLVDTRLSLAQGAAVFFDPQGLSNPRFTITTNSTAGISPIAGIYAVTAQAAVPGPTDALPAGITIPATPTKLTPGSPTSGWSTTMRYSADAIVPFSLRVTATDRAGNIGIPRVLAFIPDQAPPLTIFQTLSDSLTFSTSTSGPTVRWTETDRAYMSAQIAASLSATDSIPVFMPRESGVTGDLFGVTSIGTGTFVAVGATTAGGGMVLTSDAQATTWLPDTVPSGTVLLRSIASTSVSGNLVLIAVGALRSDGRAEIIRKVGTGPWTAIDVAGNPIQPTLSLGLLSVAAAGNIVIAVGGNGHILRSTDAGASFVDLGQGYNVLLRSVAISGSTVVAVGASGTVLRSTDSGVSWSSACGPAGIAATCSAFGSNGLWGVAAAGSLFVVVGDNATAATSSNGSSWTARDLGATVGSTITMRGVGAIATGGGYTLFAVGDQGIVLRSLDSGASWTRLISSTRFGLLAVSGDSASSAVAVGRGTAVPNGDVTPPNTPTVIASGTGVYQGAPNAAIWFAGGTSGTIYLSATSGEDLSTVTGLIYGALSSATGWSRAGADSGTGAGSDLTIATADSSGFYSTALSRASNAGTADFLTYATNSVGLQSTRTPIVLRSDTAGPTMGAFSAPATAPGSVSYVSNNLTFAWVWAPASDAGSGLPNTPYAVNLETAPFSAPASCGSPTVAATVSSLSALTYSRSNLDVGVCYRIVLSAIDRVGNSSSATSGWVTLESNGPTNPVVTFDSSGTGYLRSGDGTVIYRPDTVGGIVLSLASSDAQTSISRFTVGFSGDAPSVIPAALDGTATSTIYPVTADGRDLVVTAYNAGGISTATRISFTPDTAGPTISFSDNLGVPGPLDTSASGLTLGWTAIDATSGSGFSSETATRTATTYANGVCGTTWTSAGSFTRGSTTTLATATCYRYVVRALDVLGNASSSTYTVAADSSTPAAPVISTPFGATGFYVDAAAATVWYKPGAGAITFTAVPSAIPPSGVASVRFIRGGTDNFLLDGSSALSVTDSSSPYTATITPPTDVATDETTTASVTSVAETTGPASSAWAIRGDNTPPTSSFDFTAATLTTSSASSSFAPTWTAADVPADPNGSGLAASLAVRYIALYNLTTGSCSTFAADTSISPAPTYLSGDAETLLAARCYYWIVTSTDRVGNSAASDHSPTIVVSR